MAIEIHHQLSPASHDRADTEHQQAVGDHGTSDAQHHQVVEAAFQGRQGDHQLKQIAQGDVQQPSQPLTNAVHKAIDQLSCDLGQRDQGEAAKQEIGERERARRLRRHHNRHSAHQQQQLPATTQNLSNQHEASPTKIDGGRGT